jgi:uncharacterized SAM-binding protein YcdF (DUF218 family)
VKRRRKLLVRLLLAALGSLVLAAVVAEVFPGEILTVDSGNVQGDVMVVLGGGSYERAVRAAELFGQHAAPRIILTGAGDWEANRRILLERGVPAEAIVVEPRARSTRENARFTAALLRGVAAGLQSAATSNGQALPSTAGPLGESSLGRTSAAPCHRAIIVTSWYHSRRALRAFRKAAPEIEFYSRPSYFGYPGSADRGNAKAVRKYARAEYVKLVWYWGTEKTLKRTKKTLKY